MEEQENNKNGNGSKKIIVEIPSKKIKGIWRTKFIVKNGEIPKNLTAEDLAVVAVQNAKTEEEKQDKTKKNRLAALLLVPILLITPLLTRGCQKDEKIPEGTMPPSSTAPSSTEPTKTPENSVIETPFEIVISDPADIQNPGIPAGTINSYAGQEEKTNEFVWGDKGTYNMGEQIYYEDESTLAYTSYEDTTYTIYQAIEVLNNSESTDIEIYEAIKVLEEQYGIRINIRQDLQPGMEHNAERFNKATELHPDARTETEEAMVQDILQEAQEDLEKEKEALEAVEEISQAIQEGKTIEGIQVTQNENGEYIITGTLVEELIKTRTTRGITQTGETYSRMLIGENKVKYNSEEGR